MDNREATAEQISFFREQGWLVVENAIEQPEIAEVAARMEVGLRKKHKLAYDWAWEKGRSKEEREFKIVQGNPSMVWPEIARERFRTWMIAFCPRLDERDGALVPPVPGQTAARRRARLLASGRGLLGP